MGRTLQIVQAGPRCAPQCPYVWEAEEEKGRGEMVMTTGPEAEKGLVRAKCGFSPTAREEQPLQAPVLSSTRLSLDFRPPGLWGNKHMLS